MESMLLKHIYRNITLISNSIHRIKFQPETNMSCMCVCVDRTHYISTYFNYRSYSSQYTLGRILRNFWWRMRAPLQVNHFGVKSHPVAMSSCAMVHSGHVTSSDVTTDMSTFRTTWNATLTVLIYYCRPSVDRIVPVL
jgi:hypothetical protein